MGSSILSVLKMANEERHCFITEWYDSHAEIKRRYQLMHYPKDNTIEMYDIKNKRKFLNRTKHTNLPERLLIGTKLQIHSRQHSIVDYGDDKTRKEHTGHNESCCIVLKAGFMRFIGQVIQTAINNDLKVTNVRSVRLSNNNVLPGVGSGDVVAFELKGQDVLERVQKSFSTNASFQPDIMSISATLEEAEAQVGLFFHDMTRLGGTSKCDEGCTCAVIKPHAMKKAGLILDEILNQGFSISAVRMHSMDRKEVEEFYEVYRDVVNEYSAMVDELSCGPSLILEIAGHDKSDNVHKEFRQFCGPSDTKVAKAIRPNTIRAKFGVNKVQNAIHCTDLETDGAFESNFMFNVL